ncbi:hypothetical protein J6590_041696 [Homalodisca vitripennis]|nr:hypothetical protein J6590_041696 [Homalodisca vitripennis]
MDRDHLTVSEVDRQLLSDLSGSDNDSNFSLSDIFDDTDEDPTYTPVPDTQPRFQEDKTGDGFKTVSSGSRGVFTHDTACRTAGWCTLY